MEVLLIDASAEMKVGLIQYDHNIQHFCTIIQNFHQLSSEIQVDYFVLICKVLSNLNFIGIIYLCVRFVE